MPYKLQIEREQVSGPAVCSECADESLCQYSRIVALEDLVKRLSAKDEKKEKDESEAPILMGTGRLMIGNGSVNGMAPPAMQMPMQTGMAGYY